MQTKTQYEEMAQALRDKWSACEKVDAIRYLKKLYPSSHINDCIIAYNIAY